jgi:hypothetical protein
MANTTYLELRSAGSSTQAAKNIVLLDATGLRNGSATAQGVETIVNQAEISAR